MKKNTKIISYKLPNRTSALLTQKLQFNNKSSELRKTISSQFNTTRRLFSTTRHLLIPLEELRKLRNQISGQLTELNKERQILENDLENIKEAMAAGSKVAMEEALSKEESEVLKEYKENYPAFIDSDDEAGPPSILNKLKELKNYFLSELGINKKSMEKLSEKRSKIIAQTESQTAEASSSKANPISQTKEMSSNITNSTNEIVEASSSRTVVPSQLKRKSDYLSDSEESSSSKKSRSTPTNDYIDSLPDLPYNPFDDIGYD